jgi:hypothetical protein
MMRLLASDFASIGSLLSPSLSKHTLSLFHTLSFETRTHTLSLSKHTLSLSLDTHTLSFETHAHTLSKHTYTLSLSKHTHIETTQRDQGGGP